MALESDDRRQKRGNGKACAERELLEDGPRSPRTEPVEPTRPSPRGRRSYAERFPAMARRGACARSGRDPCPGRGRSVAGYAEQAPASMPLEALGYASIGLI